MYCLTFTHISYNLIVNNHSAIDVYKLELTIFIVTISGISLSMETRPKG